MRIRIVTEETRDSVNLSEYSEFGISPPEDIEDSESNEGQFLEYFIKLFGDEPDLLPDLIAIIKDSVGIEEDQEVTEDIELYFGNTRRHKVYFKMLAQIIMAQFNKKPFAYDPDENMGDKEEPRDSGDDTTDTATTSKEDEEEEDEDNNEEPGSPEADEADEGEQDEPEEDESEQRREREPDQVQTYRGIPIPTSMPMPKTTSDQMEQLAARRNRGLRANNTHGNMGPELVRSNFRPPEQPESFARRSDPLPGRVPQPRPDLDMQKFTFRGTQITTFAVRPPPAPAVA